MSERKDVLLIHVAHLKKPIGVPEYTHEATVHGLANCSQYFYGNSTAETLTKVLLAIMEKKP